MDVPPPKEDVDHHTILQLLKTSKPKIAAGAEGKYDFPPFIPKAKWSSLGDKVVKAERLQVFNVPGDKWISLRLDGHGFSKLTKKLKRDGVLEQGYSATMASWMQECCTSLMDFTSAKYGYTQSDEITVLIPPASVTTKGDEKIQQPHIFSGRVLKICTLASSHVTLVWNKCVAKKTADWSQYDCTFDCRMGAYDSAAEALSLILWRSYDCSINGISDACYHQRGKLEGAKQAVNLPTNKKIEFLVANNLLPLQNHQAYGSFYARVKRSRKAVNPQNQQEVLCLRSVVEKVEGNILNLAAADKLTPVDDPLIEAAENKS